MKKITSIVLTFVLVLALCVGCNPAQTPNNNNNGVNRNGNGMNQNGMQNEVPQNGDGMNETPPTETSNQ